MRAIAVAITVLDPLRHERAAIVDIGEHFAGGLVADTDSLVAGVSPSCANIDRQRAVTSSVGGSISAP